MTIWYVFMTFPAPSETFAGIEVHALHERGADLAIFCLRQPHPAAERLKREWGIEDIPIEHGSFTKAFRGALAGMLRFPKLAGMLLWLTRQTWRRPHELVKSLILIPLVFNLYVEIQRREPDVVHLFWGHYPALLGYLVHRYCPGVVLSMFLGAYDMRQRFPCSVDVASTADVVWTHTRHNVGELVDAGIPAEKIRVNYRGINFSQAGDVSGDKIPYRVFSAGRLLGFKGMDDVLRVFRRIRERCPEASLVIAGDGPEMRTLQQLSANLGLTASVRFLGQVSHARVYDEMQQADVFLFMSKIERLPNVVKEAMACRCLCAVTETPGIRELVQDRINGLIVPREVEGAATAVLDVLGRQVDRAALAERGHETVAERFDVKRNVLHYLATWQRLRHGVQGRVKTGMVETS